MIYEWRCAVFVKDGILAAQDLAGHCCYEGDWYGGDGSMGAPGRSPAGCEVLGE